MEVIVVVLNWRKVNNQASWRLVVQKRWSAILQEIIILVIVNSRYFIISLGEVKTWAMIINIGFKIIMRKWRKLRTEFRSLKPIKSVVDRSQAINTTFKNALNRLIKELFANLNGVILEAYFLILLLEI